MDARSRLKNCGASAIKDVCLFLVCGIFADVGPADLGLHIERLVEIRSFLDVE